MSEIVELLVETIRMSYASRTLDEICRHLRMMHSADDVSKARKVVEAEIQRIRSLRDPAGLVDPELKGWYLGPSEKDAFWPVLVGQLLSGGWTDDGVAGLDAETTRIVSLLDHPGLGTFKRRGLVVGYVQSGKTANFTGVVAKAADAGYRLFIIMSGVTNKLRRQTQMRFDSDLRNAFKERWIALTDENQDFTKQNAGNVDAFLTQYAQHKTVCVMKKIHMRLKLMADWLESARPEVLQNCPVLIIDDEADEASINTAKTIEMRSRANKQICRLVKLLPKVAYIGYTATPFANVFIDPADDEDLYPRDFILDLPRKAGYFGAEKIFGRGDLSPEEAERDKSCIDVVRILPSEEAARLRPSRGNKGAFSVQMNSLPNVELAVRWFWLATACRRLRRGKADFHSSMLVHSSQLAAVHNAFRRPLEALRDRSAKRLASGEQSEVDAFRTIWQQESSRVRADDFGLQHFGFDDIVTVLQDVVEGTKIVIENYLADRQERLAYGDEPQTVIVVGGSILARGLTLEGLVTSVFVRSASAYDALLQMGRWFGYRRGYEDLPRIWMSSELKAYFFDLATVEEEIRCDIARYEREGITPIQFAPRIRTHPALMITSRLKMQHAVRCSASYDEKRIQTTIFRHLDQDWLNENMTAARALLKHASDDGIIGKAAAGGRILYESVPGVRVREFLNSYKVHERHEMFRRDVLGRYIEAENAVGALLHWNIVVMGHGNAMLGTLDLGSGCRPNLIRRSRLKDVGGDEFANIKALMSESDVCADMSNLPDTMNREDRFALRNRQLPGRGLLLLYPISRASKAEVGYEDRVNLDATNDVIGLALVFPQTARAVGAVDYMTADLSAVDQDKPEVPPETIEEAAA